MRVLFFLLTLFVLAFQQPASAQDERYTDLRLYAEKAYIAPGETITLAVEQIIAPGWHTYWKNPGDSGAKPNFVWSVPDGFVVGEPQWPNPKKIPYGPLMNYGYESRAITLHTLTAPEDFDAFPFELVLDMDVLVCADICIPEFDTLKLNLNEVSDETLLHKEVFETARSSQAQVKDWSSTYKEAEGLFELTVELPSDITSLADAYFIPSAWGVIDNAAKAGFKIQDQTLIISQARGDRALDDAETFSYILSLENKAGKTSYYLSALVSAGANVEESVTPDQLSESGVISASLLFVLVSAFLGGLILNLMPCVFPVLSIKVLSLVKLSDEHPEHARLHGLAYTAGVVLSFLAVAGSLIAFQIGGAEIGWGFQLQNPLIVTLLAFLLFVVGLNLIGLFEVGASLQNTGGKLTQKSGVSGAFFTGVLATIVATPCTAPFMATAIGFALTQPITVSLLVFAVLGFGLAFPYLLLSFVPALHKFLPKPGTWMRTFQQFLAFPMFGAVIWLLWVLAQQVADAQLLAVMMGMLAIAFGIWLWPKGKIFVKIIAVLSFSFALLNLPLMAQMPSAQVGDKQFGENFSPAKLDVLLAETNQPVFVEMTAAWCITCKVNHAAALNIDSTKAIFQDLDVAYLIGDWTNKDPEITQYLKSFNRSGVPIYVFYPAAQDDKGRPEPVILPQILTPSIVEKAITQPYL